MKRLLPPLFPLLAAAGLLIALLLYRQTFREASIELRVGRAEAEQRALSFLAAQGVSATGRWHSTSFQTDTSAQDYLIATAGLAELEALAGRDLNLASWHVRLFTPLDPEEWGVDVSSRSGRILSFQHTQREEAAGATMPITDAQQLALTTIAARPGGPPASELRLLARRVTRQPNRTDQTFTWERPALARGDATYRYTVTIAGDKVGSIDEFYNLPESWGRLARWHARRGALLNLLGWTATYALMAGLGLAWLWAASHRRLRLRFALILLAVIGVVGLSTALNSIPLILASLPTNISVPAYLAEQISGYLGTALVLAGAVLIAGMAGEALLPHSVSAFPFSISRALTRRGLVSAPLVRSLLIGICVGMGHLGFITLFYWIGQRWFGVWSPLDPNYDDLLSTPLPWLYALALGLLPAIGEELVFRLGGIMLIQRITGMPRLAVVATALTWASLHTTYTQQPFYIRLVELSIVGMVFGAICMRYGVLSSMAAHYTYNAALMAPLLAQGSWATRAGAALAIGGAALLLLPALARRVRGLPLEDTDVEATLEQETSRQVDKLTKAQANPEGSSQLLRLGVRSGPASPWLLGLALAGLAAWLLARWLLPQPQLFDRNLTRSDALAAAMREARSLRLATDGLYGATYPDATLLNLDTQYLRDNPGAQDARQLIDKAGQRAAWRVRFSQWDRDDTLTLWLGQRGALLAFDRSLPEDAPGAAIAQAQARQLAEALLRRQAFDLNTATLVESSTITRTNRVDHRFVWQSAQVLGAAAHARVLVAVQGKQVATLSPYLYTPPEYRRERDRSTLLSLLGQDALPSLPPVVALLLAGACLLLALRARQPLPLQLIIAAGLAGASATLLSSVLRLDAAQLAQPPRLLQGLAYGLYSAILSAVELGLLAGGTEMLWARYKNQEPRTKNQIWQVGSRYCAIGLALLPGLLAFGALRAGLAAAPGAVSSPSALSALLPALALLLDGALSALRTTLLLAGALALLMAWRPLRPIALPALALGATLVAARPDRLPVLALALLAWPAALLLGRWLWSARGGLGGLALGLWWATCLPDALALFALDQWWYALNGMLAIMLLLAPLIVWATQHKWQDGG